MTIIDLLTRLAEVAKDPPGTPEHSAPDWLRELCDRHLVVLDGGALWTDDGWVAIRPPQYNLTKAGALALEAWRMPPPVWPSAH